jgi:hypothetical protein
MLATSEASMPMHDWTRVNDAIYHDFYLSWVSGISDGLNRGLLPPDYYALIERHSMDVAEWERGIPDGEFPARPPAPEHPNLLFLSEVPPSTPTHDQCEALAYWRNARSITVRSAEDHLAVAVIELITPAVRRVPVARQRFLQQMSQALYRGIHLLVIDPFVDPGSPEHVPSDLWKRLTGRPLMNNISAGVFAAFAAGPEPEVFVDTVNLGSVLPEMPVFLAPDAYVLVDLDAAYQWAWDGTAKCLKDQITG